MLFHGRVYARDHDRGRDHENGRGRDALLNKSVNDLLHSREVVVPTMNKCGTKEIQTKAYAANDQDKHRIIDSCVLLESADCKEIHFWNSRHQDSRWMLMNLSIDCRRMLIPKASRKTPLKKAPMRRALCQPNERSWRAVAFSEIWTVHMSDESGVVEQETYNLGR